MILSSRPAQVGIADLETRLLAILNTIMTSFDEEQYKDQSLSETLDLLEEATFAMCIANSELNEMHNRAVLELAQAAVLQSEIISELRQLSAKLRRLALVDDANPDFQVAYDVLTNGAKHTGVLTVDLDDDQSSLPLQSNVVEIDEELLLENFKLAMSEYIARHLT